MTRLSLESVPPSFGFRAGIAGPHTARSMMIVELTELLRATPRTATRSDYKTAVINNNILGKRTASNRIKSLHHLVQLYGLDPELALFRTLRGLAQSDPVALPALALVMAFCRDPQLRQSFELIKTLRPGEPLTREAMEEHLEAGFPRRFSAAMKKSLAQNVNTTWTFSGHLKGSANKTRQLPECSPSSTAFAMLAGYLAGLRGQRLLHSDFGRLVAADSEVLTVQLSAAAARGLLVFRHAGGVIEFDFRRQLRGREQELCDIAS
jgi:hypothetical protein